MCGSGRYCVSVGLDYMPVMGLRWIWMCIYIIHICIRMGGICGVYDSQIMREIVMATFVMNSL